MQESILLDEGNVKRDERSDFQFILNVTDGDEMRAPSKPVKFVDNKLKKTLQKITELALCHDDAGSLLTQS